MGFSIISTGGLVLGLLVFLFILQYVTFEWSYDKYHENKDEIYRVTLEQYQNNELVHATAENYPAVGPALKRDLNEVEDYARLYNLGSKNNIAVTREVGNQKIAYKQRRLLYASEDFLKMFSYEMVAGNPDHALREPFQMVISESYARKYFGEEDPVGQHLRMQDDDFNDELCKVTGVVKDVRANSHLKFDILISYSTLYARYDGSERARERYDQSWERKDMYTYVRLKEGANPEDVALQLPRLIDRYMPDLEAQNRREVMHLQPLTEIHLYSDLNNEPETHGNGRAIFFLLIIALFVLGIAYINYVNLSTARSVERANEVGMRKVLGARPLQLVHQFLMEALLINIVAMILSVGLYVVLQPVFNGLTGIWPSEEFWEFGLWNHSTFVPVIAGLIITGTVLSGLYPALVLSRYRPIRILGNQLASSSGGILFRRALVVLQFSICVGLIIGTIIVYQQMHLMQSQDLGFNPAQIVVVEQPSVFSDFESRMNSVRGFKNDLRIQPRITDVMSTLVIPGKKARWRFNVRRLGQPDEQSRVFNFNLVDEYFIPGFGMKVIAGRNFSSSIAADRDTGCIITMRGAEVLGYDKPEDAVGQVLSFAGGDQSIVIGVINDYNQESLHEEAQPTILFLDDYAEFYLMRISAAEVEQSLGVIKSVWNQRFPGNPFHYFFMDDHFNAQYAADIRFQKLFMLFAILAIVVACMGLFGLSAFIAQKRQREIGIRKVLGATKGSIIFLLTTDFARLILLANAIAWPLIAWLMHQWLANFAIRTALHPWTFIGAGLLVLLLGAGTVLFHALQAASANPAKVIGSD